jgi:fructuronate reductase
MDRLSAATLARLPADVAVPDYERAALRTGIVHFGPGAFHRAHQAAFVDRMLAGRPDLAICAVALRTPDLRDAIGPQDGLYALLEREAAPTLRVIGSIREVLVAAEAPEAVFARLDAARIVTATVTEKGYALGPDGGLDVGHPEIRRDLAERGRPTTLVGWLTEGLRRRKAADLPPFTTISCDNLTDNGGKLKRAVVRFAEAAVDADLARWIDERAAFPASMVDSITPATDDALRAEVAARLGLVDAWPVQRERFMQWVVEDALDAADAEAFAAAGVTLARDVAPFERAKLRLLNGAHSTLAYVGLALGHETVAGAMADPGLAAFAERLMRDDVAPTLAASELDVAAYIGEVLARFRNPAIVHRLAQIAWDGSQKLPIRLLGTIADALRAGRPVDRLVAGVAAWMAFVRRAAAEGRTITDPMAPSLLALGAAAQPADFLALEAIFPSELAADERFRRAVERAFATITGPEPRSVLSHPPLSSRPG